MLVGDFVGVRTKWSDSVDQVSIAEGLYLALLPSYSSHPALHERLALIVMGGASIFTFESIAGQTSASIGSPFIQVAGWVELFDQWGLSASVSLEDDIRFIDLPSTGYLSFNLGFTTIAGHARVAGLASRMAPHVSSN